jgi:dTMP kinase
LWFDVATFLVSATTVATLALPRRATSSSSAHRVDFGRAIRDLREGFVFIRRSPMVRAVLIGLACGLGGGGTVVPLGPVFSDKVLHSGASGFGVLLTAFGIGVAVGILVVSLVQKRLPHGRVFLGAAFTGGVCLIVAASMAKLLAASLWIVGFGLCTGTVYVLGFSLLQSEVTDELRGRVFATLYASTRLCLFLALVVAPVLATGLDGISRASFNRRLRLGGFTVHLQGVRLTLWLGGLVVIVAAALARRALRSATPSSRALGSQAPSS